MTGSEAGPQARQDSVARAIKRARKRYGTMRSFADDLRAALGWESLSVAAVYAWEAGTTRVPAVGLVAAAELAGVSLDRLLSAEDDSPSRARDNGSTHVDALAAKVGRLEDRVELLERRIPVQT